MTTAQTRLSKSVKPLVCSIATLLLCGNSAALAGSATWLANPSNGNWNNSANWSPNTVPSNFISDVGTFDKSSITNIFFSNSFSEFGGIAFTQNASAFTFNVPFNVVDMGGVGIVNNSGKTQNFVIGQGGLSGTILFERSTTAGMNTVFTALGSVTGGEGSAIKFFENSSANGATLIATGGGAGNGGQFGHSGAGIFFYIDSTGGTATIKLYGNGFMDASVRDIPTLTIGSLEGNGNVFLGPPTYSWAATTRVRSSTALFRMAEKVAAPAVL
jgi:hypothetical protein